MAFSFDTTLAILNGAVNELSRAARDLGDSQADSALSERLNAALSELSACVDEFSAERDRRAAGGTAPDPPAASPKDVKLREEPAKPAASTAPAPAKPAAKTDDK